MQSDLVDIGWTETQWSRVLQTVTEEAQKVRVAAQALPISGPYDPSTVALPNFTLGRQFNPLPPAPPPQRLTVNSDPNLYLTTIAVNVQVRSHEAADPDLTAAMGMFRRAANFVGRIEDALVFNGRLGGNLPPAGLAGMPNVFTVHGDGAVRGIFWPPRAVFPVPPGGPGLVNAVVRAIDFLEAQGQLGPFACLLGHRLFNIACSPTGNLVLPRDRILPFLQGPLLRSSAIMRDWGAVIALSGSPVEIAVASDIGVRFLQTTPEPRFVFRVSERVALRIKEHTAIALLRA